MLRFIPVILAIVIGLVFVVIGSDYYTGLWVNNNTDNSFETRATEHLRQENLSVDFHNTIIQNQFILNEKVDNLQDEINKLKNASS